jgi:hypothetical protein
MYWIDDEIKAKKREERTREYFDITQKIQTKLESIGVKKKSAIIAISDIGSLYQYADDTKKLIELIIETPSTEWDRLEDIFVSLRIILGEMKDHIKDSRVPLDYLADYCERHKPPGNKE